MEKQIKNKKKVLIIIIIIFIITIVVSMCNISKTLNAVVDKNIMEQTDVYIPESVPKKYHSTLFSIDTFDYWIFKLNEKEISSIENELDNGNWSILNASHVLKLSELDYLKIVRKYSTLQQCNCYLCIYDFTTGEIITNSDESIIVSSSNWVVFFYDVSSGYYCCIHESY